MYVNKYEAKRKYALALVRERDELCKQRWNIAAVKLDKPIQHGYVRNLELRDDVKYRRDYNKIKEVVNFLGQIKAYHANEDFLIKTRKNTIEKHAMLKGFSDPRFKFYYSEDKRQSDIDTIKSYSKYLRLHQTLFECNCSNESKCLPQHFIIHYVFAYPWMLKEVTKPHFLTHYTPLDSEIESRLQEINQEMYSHNYYKLLDHRRIYDKLDNEQWNQFKYGKNKTIIYHALNEMNV